LRSAAHPLNARTVTAQTIASVRELRVIILTIGRIE
jgi:hypothetical protein